MFKFFYTKKWMMWSLLGTGVILFMTWYMVQLDLRINTWFGGFYDTLQKALSAPNTVTLPEFLGFMTAFLYIAGLWVIVAVIKDFFVAHYTFRWRTSMTEYYQANYVKLHNTEGASQRIQEDTQKFARMVEGLGVGLLDAMMTIIAFLPVLWGFSRQISVLPYIGHVDHALIYVAVGIAIVGTIILLLVGIKLPTIEYNIQKQEAQYRKYLVLGEDDITKASPSVLNTAYDNVRRIQYYSYFNYFYFNMVKWSLLQSYVIIPYVALAPTIIAGTVTLGFIQQVIRAFGRVETSMQYILRSWGTIVELMSVYKRLREFERQI